MCDAARTASVAFKNRKNIQKAFDQFNRIPSGYTPDQIAVWLMNNVFGKKSQPGKGIWEIMKKISYAAILKAAQNECCAEDPFQPGDAFDLYLRRPTIDSLGTSADRLRTVNK